MCTLCDTCPPHTHTNTTLLPHRFGATFLSEGGALLQEMNSHVFSSDVVDVLAPSTNDSNTSLTCTPCETTSQTATGVTTTKPTHSHRVSVPKTVGLCGDEIPHVVDLARCLARAGHNLVVAAPSKVAASALGAFNTCAGREGRSIGVMPEAFAPAHRRNVSGLCGFDESCPLATATTTHSLTHRCNYHHQQLPPPPPPSPPPPPPPPSTPPPPLLTPSTCSDLYLGRSVCVQPSRMCRFLFSPVQCSERSCKVATL
jgi:hypothetical protein